MILRLTLYSKELTTEQLNMISHFCELFALHYGKENIELYSSKTPLFLNGNLSELTVTARRYFNRWNEENSMRNIRIIKQEHRE